MGIHGKTSILRPPYLTSHLNSTDSLSNSFRYIYQLWYHPHIQAPSAQCMLGYGQQAGGKHPTGMLSCSFVVILRWLAKQKRSQNRGFTLLKINKKCYNSNKIDKKLKQEKKNVFRQNSPGHYRLKNKIRSQKINWRLSHETKSIPSE